MSVADSGTNVFTHRHTNREEEIASNDLVWRVRCGFCEGLQTPGTACLFWSDQQRSSSGFVHIPTNTNESGTIETHKEAREDINRSQQEDIL